MFQNRTLHNCSFHGFAVLHINTYWLDLNSSVHQTLGRYGDTRQFILGNYSIFHFGVLVLCNILVGLLEHLKIFFNEMVHLFYNGWKQKEKKLPGLKDGNVK